jgi:hypothetical protein
MTRFASAFALGFALAFVSIAASVPSARADDSLSVADKAALQAAMQQHIDRSTVNGVWHKVDWETGKTRKLHPASAHPMLVRLFDHYVLCTDFRDEKGNGVNADFYLARRGKGFVVFQTEIDNRGPLIKLWRDGKAVHLH